MNRKMIENHLKSAVDAMTPDLLDGIDLTTSQEPPVPVQRKSLWPMAAARRGMAVAACICAVTVGGVLWQENRVAAVVELDVNPSIALTLNWRNKVLDVQALNQDAQAVVNTAKIRGAKADEAVGSLIGSMVSQGYLQSDRSTILVTVNQKDQEKSAALKEEMGKALEQSLEEHQVQAVVYSQEVVPTEETRQLAETYQISCGKAEFLQGLIDSNEDLNEEHLEDMAQLNMEQLSQEIEALEYALGGSVQMMFDSQENVVETTVPEETVGEDTGAEEWNEDGKEIELTGNPDEFGEIATPAMPVAPATPADAFPTATPLDAEEDEKEMDEKEI